MYCPIAKYGKVGSWFLMVIFWVIWSDNHWIENEWQTAIWHKCETLLVAGELLDVCTCTLSTRMAVGRCVGNSYLKYVVSKKDWPSENCMKEPTV